jgi:hypothetical protein
MVGSMGKESTRVIVSSLVVTAITLASCTTEHNAVTVEHDYDLPSTCQEITLAARHDLGGRPFVYVTAKEGGLRVYDASAGDPKVVATMPSSLFNSLHVMNLSQTGDRLFLALGNTFGTAVQTTGMAIVDVSDPPKPKLLSVWLDPTQGGTGIAVSEGSFAYLGAMQNGLITFDVSDPAKPRELSRFVPPIDFPDARPDPSKINARGMAIAGDIAWVCYDAGGLRAIDVSDKAHPKEIGRYSNPALNNKPRAYNNVVLDGTLAYVGFDYCGIEVLDITDPKNIKSVSWYNPWRCETGPLTWFSSDGHANEVALDRTNRLLFVSSGKSDLEVLDVKDPQKLVRVGGYGGTDNGIGSWGVSIRGDQILLTYTCAIVPFVSTWSGVKALRFRR